MRLRYGCVLLPLLVLLASLQPATARAAALTVAWSPNPDPYIAGYILHYGTQSGVYTTHVDVGNQTVFIAAGLTGGQRYYFAVQAYSTTNVKSALSSELSGVAPPGSTPYAPGSLPGEITVPELPPPSGSEPVPAPAPAPEPYPTPSPTPEPEPPPASTPSPSPSPTPAPTPSPAPSPTPSAPTPLATQTAYLSEGATGSFFDLDISLANSAATAAPVILQFLKEDGSTLERALELAPMSQQVVHVNEIPGLESAAFSTTVKSTSAVVVERTMFWDKNRYGGHGTSGVTSTSMRWYFAEGSQGFFDTYFLLSNPGTTNALVNLFFLRENSTIIVKLVTVKPMSRLTIHAGSIPALVGKSFATIVSSSTRIVAERAMYFGKTQLWAGGHESAGISTLSTSWFHAEGATGPYFDTYILVGNPNNKPADVTVTFLTQEGTSIVKTYSIGGYQRLTIDVEAQDPRLAHAAVSTTVRSSIPVVSERAMYWPGTPATWTEAHNSFGIAAPGTKWGLAEGRSGGPEGFETYILLANPGAIGAEVRVTFLRSSGSPIARRFSVGPTSRFNIDVNRDVPELAGQTFGALIESTNGVPIVVERAMYWDALGQIWAGGTNVVAMPLQ